MRTDDFSFDLPPELIAQQATAKRDLSRLMVIHRGSGRIEHRSFRDLGGYFRPGDVLILNDSKVIPARLRARNAHTRGQFEVLLLEENARNDWWVMLRPAKRARIGTRLLIQDLQSSDVIEATVVETNADGHRRLRFGGEANIFDVLERIGEVPLPPYIRREGGALAEDSDRYQTVYAEIPGSVAAPTAGLHFTPETLTELCSRGVQTAFVTLHVGVGTFAPVKAQTIGAHKMHAERYEVTEETARVIANAKHDGRRVIAVGTTSVRVLESVALASGGEVLPGKGRTSLFIFPPFNFRIVEVLLTNFHLPRSTLLMLASAFTAPGRVTGRETLLGAYREAIREHYRFFSYGDAMLLT